MTFGFDAAIEIPMRPFVVSGRLPPFTSVHVFPASVVFQSALPGPPLLRKYGPRTRCQLAANSTSGFDGSSATSTKPAWGEIDFTSCQVCPPSVVLLSPRSGFWLQACSSAATYTMLGALG